MTERRLLSIRRYPVKAMGGESLATVEVNARGLAGDRAHAVLDARGMFAAGKHSRRFRRHDEIFEYTARSTSTGVAVARHDAARGPWSVGESELDTELSACFGEPMQVRPEGTVSHFDDCPVSVVGTASLAWFAEEHGLLVDPRRLRVNLVVQTSDAFEEDSWTGLQIGSVGFEAVKKITRCRVVDLAQDGLMGATPLLKMLGPTREMKLGTYLRVTRPGSLAVADGVLPDA